jgi:membrane associated rhomboid family serine protease
VGLRRFPWLTAALSVAATIAFAFAASGMSFPGVTGEGGPVDLANALHVVGLGARSTPLVVDAGESWRLFTCHFVHTSWLHLVFNVVFLFSVGGALEQVVRRSDYAALLLLVGVGSAITSLVATPQVSAGASGLVFGTLGAAVSFGLRNHDVLAPRVRRYFGLWVLPFLLIIFGLGVGNPTVDQGSHLGGLLVGLVFGLWLPPAHAETPRGMSPALAIAATTAVLGLLAAPVVAGSGTQRAIELDTGATVHVPTNWQPRYGPLGEVEFTTAGGMVVLTADRVPAQHEGSAAQWYEQNRLKTLAPAGRAEGLERIDEGSIRTSSASGRWVRYRLRRDNTPMVRDVHFLCDPAGRSATTVLALETPITWAEKYDETRLAIVGSIRTATPREHPTSAAAATP